MLPGLAGKKVLNFSKCMPITSFYFKCVFCQGEPGSRGYKGADGGEGPRGSQGPKVRQDFTAVEAH